jgi:prepilin-type N-terminal cleavage/methylation domain-containing protein
MSRLRNRRQRGNTLVEMLSVLVILALLMTMVLSVLVPLLRAPNRSQAKLDTLEAAAAASYRIQRDLRQTLYNDAWACTTGAGATCSQPGTLSNATTAIALLTAYQNGTGQFQTQTGGTNVGYPSWQGVTVYWIDGSGDLHWAFYQPSSGFPETAPSLSAVLAAQAVQAATTGTVSSTQIAAGIQQLEAAFPMGLTNIISFQMQAQSNENNSTNETTYRSDVLARG